MVAPMWRNLLMALSDISARLAGLPPRAEREEQARIMSRYSYTSGPMYYVGQQICSHMQKLGWPARIHSCYRSPEDQDAAFKRGASKARAYQSPHQYWLAVDIIHASKGWEAPPRFWTDLVASGEVVAKRLNFPLEFGHNWKWNDSCHIQAKEWKGWKGHFGPRHLNQADLDKMFEALLPKVWRVRPRR